MWTRKLSSMLNLIIIGGLALQAAACRTNEERGQLSAQGEVSGGQASDSTNPGQATKSVIDTCALLSKAEVAAILNKTEAEIGDPVPGPDLTKMGVSECNWDLVDAVQDNTIFVRRLQITLMQDAGIASELSQNGVSAASQYDVFYQNRDTQKAVDLAGLGDKAFIDVRFNEAFQEYLAPSVHFLKPGIYAKVFTSNPTATLTEIELQLSVYSAKKAAEKLAERL